MFQTLITNNTHTPTRVSWRTGCATPVGAGEVKLVDGAPFEFRNPRETAALLERCKSGALTIALVTNDDFEILSIEVAGQRAAKSAANKPPKPSTAPTIPVTMPASNPTVPVATDADAVQKGNTSLLTKGSIEDAKPKGVAMLPGTEAVTNGPTETVGIFEDMPALSKEAQAYITANKLTRKILQGLKKVKGTGENGVITLDDLQLFLNPPAPAEPEEAKAAEQSAAAKKMIKDLGITDEDLKSIVPTGKKGAQITKGDVQLFIDNKS